jgi:hypothetical protein
MQARAAREFAASRAPAAVLLCGALLIPHAAHAAPAVGATVPFAIAPGETVTLGPGAGLDLRVSAAGEAPAAPEGPAAPKNQTAEHMLSVPLTFGAAPGTLRFTFWDDADNGARLKLENGLPRGVIYAAEIVYRSNGKVEETTICSVSAGRPAVESWPDDLAAIRITGLYDAPPGGQVWGYAARGQLSTPPSTIPAPQ